MTRRMKKPKSKLRVSSHMSDKCFIIPATQFAI